MFDSDVQSAGEAELPHDNAANTDSPNEAQPVVSTRYRDTAMSWLALGALLAVWHSPSRVDRPTDESKPRIAARSSLRGEQPWVRRATETRSWLTGVPHGVARSPQTATEQPGWSALASVRTARRWLGSRDV